MVPNDRQTDRQTDRETDRHAVYHASNANIQSETNCDLLRLMIKSRPYRTVIAGTVTVTVTEDRIGIH